MFGLLLTDPEARVGSGKRRHLDTPPTSWRISGPRLLGIGGVTLIRVATVLHLTTLPLALVNDFGGTLREIPCMLAWGWAAGRVSKEAILVVNALIYALYLLLGFFANSVTDVLWLQGLNAVATAALLSITISYMQETIKRRVGLSTALMDVTTVASVFIASAAFAALSSGATYKTVFAAASTVSLAAVGLIAMGCTLRFAGSAHSLTGKSR
jgi:MFS transporter, SET family, sugar efflux transporter